MSEGKLKNCHVEEGRIPDVNISAYSHPSFSLENVKGSSNYKEIKSGRSLDLAFQLGAMTRRDCHVVSLLTMTAILFSFNVQAECTPTPDCASIGYTETSCEGDSLKCPFDITKLKCMPCDSSFRYDCSGDNIVEGTGFACGGKYVSCECSGGGVFNNGECPQPLNCTVGMIYYSDKSCSTELDSNKTAIGVVVKDNELVVSQRLANDMTWGGYGTDISTLTNYSSSTDAKTDFNGKDNTALIVAAHTSAGLTSSVSATIYCNEYSTEGTNAGDWYLPAAGELYKYVYGGGTNYSKINTTMTTLGWTFGSRYFWSSSELSANLACLVYSDYGYVTNDSKNYNYAVSCFLAIN